MSLAVIVGAMIIGSEKLYTYYMKTRNHRILIIGPPETGKSTFIYQLENNVPIAPELDKTMKTDMFARSIMVDYDDNKRRRIKTKDVPGEGYANGMWWKLLLELKPTGIIFIVDDRVIQEDAGNEQRFAFRYFTEIITGAEYKKIVKPKNRAQVMMLVANKMDIWGSQGQNNSINEMLEVLTADLHRIGQSGIIWNWAAMSAKFGRHVDTAYQWVIRTLEKKEDI